MKYLFILIFLFSMCEKEELVKSEPKIHLQKYECTYNIKFNSLDLIKAGKIEKDLRQRYGYACELTINIEPHIVINSNYNSIDTLFCEDDTSRYYMRIYFQ